MSEDKRQTRLLTFSPRRAEADHGAHESFAGDAELRALLGAWEAPAGPSGSRERLLASFRARVARPPLWKRALTSTVRVPLPFAACAALALLLAAYALGSRPAQTHTATAGKAETKAGTKAEPAVRVVEVPVERIVEVPVERVVYVEKYVEKKERTAAARPPKPGAALAARDSRGEGHAPQATSEASYVTPLDMAEFLPAEELRMRVIRRGKTDED